MTIPILAKLMSGYGGPIVDAADVQIDRSGFTGLLSAIGGNVQLALAVLDALQIPSPVHTDEPENVARRLAALERATRYIRVESDAVWTTANTGIFWTSGTAVAATLNSLRGASWTEGVLSLPLSANDQIGVYLEDGLDVSTVRLRLDRIGADGVTSEATALIYGNQLIRRGALATGEQVYSWGDSATEPHTIGGFAGRVITVTPETTSLEHITDIRWVGHVAGGNVRLTGSYDDAQALADAVAQIQQDEASDGETMAPGASENSDPVQATFTTEEVGTRTGDISTIVWTGSGITWAASDPWLLMQIDDGEYRWIRRVDWLRLTADTVGGAASPLDIMGFVRAVSGVSRIRSQFYVGRTAANEILFAAGTALTAVTISFRRPVFAAGDTTLEIDDSLLGAATPEVPTSSGGALKTGIFRPDIEHDDTAIILVNLGARQPGRYVSGRWHVVDLAQIDALRRITNTGRPYNRGENVSRVNGVSNAVRLVAAWGDADQDDDDGYLGMTSAGEFTWEAESSSREPHPITIRRLRLRRSDGATFPVGFGALTTMASGVTIVTSSEAVATGLSPDTTNEFFALRAGRRSVSTSWVEDGTVRFIRSSEFTGLTAAAVGDELLGDKALTYRQFAGQTSANDPRQLISLGRTSAGAMLITAIGPTAIDSVGITTLLLPMVGPPVADRPSQSGGRGLSVADRAKLDALETYDQPGATLPVECRFYIISVNVPSDPSPAPTSLDNFVSARAVYDPIHNPGVLNEDIQVAIPVTAIEAQGALTLTAHNDPFSPWTGARLTALVVGADLEADGVTYRIHQYRTEHQSQVAVTRRVTVRALEIVRDIRSLTGRVQVIENANERRGELVTDALGQIGTLRTQIGQIGPSAAAASFHQQLTASEAIETAWRQESNPIAELTRVYRGYFQEDARTPRSGHHHAEDVEDGRTGGQCIWDDVPTTFHGKITNQGYRISHSGTILDIQNTEDSVSARPFVRYRTFLRGVGAVTNADGTEPADRVLEQTRIRHVIKCSYTVNRALTAGENRDFLRLGATGTPMLRLNREDGITAGFGGSVHQTYQRHWSQLLDPERETLGWTPWGAVLHGGQLHGVQRSGFPVHDPHAEPGEPGGNNFNSSFLPSTGRLTLKIEAYFYSEQSVLPGGRQTRTITINDVRKTQHFPDWQFARPNGGQAYSPGFTMWWAGIDETRYDTDEPYPGLHFGIVTYGEVYHAPGSAGSNPFGGEARAMVFTAEFDRDETVDYVRPLQWFSVENLSTQYDGQFSSDAPGGGRDGWPADYAFRKSVQVGFENELMLVIDTARPGDLDVNAEIGFLMIQNGILQGKSVLSAYKFDSDYLRTLRARSEFDFRRIELGADGVDIAGIEVYRIPDDYPHLTVDQLARMYSARNQNWGGWTNAPLAHELYRLAGQLWAEDADGIQFQVLPASGADIGRVVDTILDDVDVTSWPLTGGSATRDLTYPEGKSAADYDALEWSIRFEHADAATHGPVLGTSIMTIELDDGNRAEEQEFSMTVQGLSTPQLGGQSDHIIDRTAHLQILWTNFSSVRKIYAGHHSDSSSDTTHTTWERQIVRWTLKAIKYGGES